MKADKCVLEKARVMKSHDPARVARVPPGPGDPQTLHVSLSTRVSLLGRGTRGGYVHKLKS